MTTKVNSALNQYESLVENGSISSFSIFIRDKGILIQPVGSEGGKEKEVVLLQELHSSLRVFFYGVASIEHNSFDYTTLRSFINANMYMDRVAS